MAKKNNNVGVGILLVLVVGFVLWQGNYIFIAGGPEPCMLKGDIKVDEGKIQKCDGQQWVDITEPQVCAYCASESVIQRTLDGTETISGCALFNRPSGDNWIIVEQYSPFSAIQGKVWETQSSHQLSGIDYYSTDDKVCDHESGKYAVCTYGERGMSGTGTTAWTITGENCLQTTSTIPPTTTLPACDGFEAGDACLPFSLILLIVAVLALAGLYVQGR